MFVVDQKVWILEETYEQMYLILEPHAKLIDDLKRMVFGDQLDKYQAFLREQYLRPDGLISTDTFDEELIQIKRIKTRRCEYLIQLYHQINHLFICTLLSFHVQLYMQMTTMAMLA